MTSASIESLSQEEARRRDIVTSLLREVQNLNLSPALRDTRLIRRFAETRGFDKGRTLVLLKQYHSYRVERGLDDDSLPRSPGVSHEMRQRHTMRLLDPRHAPPPTQTDPQTTQTPQQTQALTFLQLSTPSLWPTARDADGCPVIYTDVAQYQGNAKFVESTLVWTCELVCREMDLEMDETCDATVNSNHGKFTILLDMTNCHRVQLPALCRLGEILQRALRRGFRGRLHRFYMYPTGRKGRLLLRVLKPLLGRYTPPKIKPLDRTDQTQLYEIFARDILPPSLGGTSELLSVQFDDIVGDEISLESDETTERDGTQKKQNGSSSFLPDAAHEDHTDLKWFLKVPALNFFVLAVMTLTSVKFAPKIPPDLGSRKENAVLLKTQTRTTRPVKKGAAKKPRRWARAGATLIVNVWTWRTIGWVGCGIERSGAWSLAAMLVTGAWRGRRG